MMASKSLLAQLFNKKTSRLVGISWLLMALGLELLSGCAAFGVTQRVRAGATVTPGNQVTPASTPLAIEPTTVAATSALMASALPFEPIAVRATDCSYGGEFKAIEALDVSTVRFSLCAPDPAFLAKIAFPAFGIQPKEWLEQTGGGGTGSQLLRKPVGTGPYKLSVWKPGEELDFEAFKDYWGAEKAKTPSLVFRWNIDSAQRLLELQAGTASGIDNVNSADFPTVEADSNLTLLHRPALNILYLGMNNTQPPFDNEKVRQALALAIDRQKLVDSGFPAGYEVASNFTPCTIPNGCAGDSWVLFDPLKAKALLKEEDLADGFEIDLTYQDQVRGYMPRPDLVAKEIKTQLWENLKVQVRIRTMEEQAFTQAVDAGTLNGLYLLGWGADYPDVSNFLDFHFGDRASLQFGNKFDDIVQALRGGAAQPDDARRKPFYEAANNAILQHVPMIPLSHGGWALSDSLAVAYAKAVQGAQASPLSLEAFGSMSIPGKDRLVWMQAAEPVSLYCADETDVESLRACSQVTESLYRYEPGGAAVQPALAEACEPNGDLTVWTCTLRKGVLFQDGTNLDANDVVTTFWVQWDAANPLHRGDKGFFLYFKSLWGGFLNSARP